MTTPRHPAQAIAPWNALQPSCRPTQRPDPGGLSPTQDPSQERHQILIAPQG
ncbi:hypothetical protein [Geitlerinema sp. PCC 7407]|uniref:hypothetical protein n=1 Tax=Geitlerinema sp. PCC 7407 TaxID=1173025 RepID=UPI00167F2ED9|nr:hypothetical protein [Geitlerinema sp. PCC 7407]